jgi:hypothetical protein
LDTDRDGQVGLDEWRAAGRSTDDFAEYDQNGDGLITPDEVRRRIIRQSQLRFDRGRATYSGTLVERPEGKHREKISYQVFTISLIAGKTYQFDHVSKVFQGFLFLEDADGTPVTEGSSGGIGENCRLVHRATRSGTYRLVATSLGGFRTGPFELTVRIDDHPVQLPPWFKELDTDRDGQVGLDEWRAAGRPVEEFSQYDLNGDGLITPDEVRGR